MMTIRNMQMSGVVLAIALVTVSLGWSQTQPTFQAGDVFAGIGNGQINWYRLNGDGYTLIKPLIVGIGGTNTFDTGMGFDAAGNLYATDFSTGDISKFDTKGNFVSFFAAGFGAPESLVFDNTGNVYVGDAAAFGGDPLVGHIAKLDPSGNLLTTFTAAREDRGTDWIDLAADQKTIFYTSEGTTIKRFDTIANTQLLDLATGLPGSHAYALRILPNGNVLIADTAAVLQLNTSGGVIQTYSPCDGACGGIFSLNLDPDGVHFWTGDFATGNIWRFNIAGGSPDFEIVTGVLPPPSGSTLTPGLFGVVVFGEPTQSHQSISLHFPPGPSTQTATFGNPGDAAAHSMALTIPNVLNPNGIDVVLTATYEPTDLSTLSHGVGIADGECELSQLGGVLANVDETKDFDCRLAKGGFVYKTLNNGNLIVPHISPYHNNMGVWYRATTNAVAGIDYIGPVYDKIAWNTNPVLVGAPTNPDYSPGWNNQNARLYDRHGSDPDIAFKFDITDFFDPNCNVVCASGGIDPTGGGHQITLNDWVFADAPNPQPGAADAVETLVPVPGTSPFTYLKAFPMLVAFELETAGTENHDATAVTKPHSVNVATVNSSGLAIPVQFPRGFPTTFTYSKLLKVYYIFLSPAPYIPGTVYTLQIGSDLFPQPVNLKFVVK